MTEPLLGFGAWSGEREGRVGGREGEGERRREGGRERCSLSKCVLHCFSVGFCVEAKVSAPFL